MKICTKEKKQDRNIAGGNTKWREIWYRIVVKSDWILGAAFITIILIVFFLPNYKNQYNQYMSNPSFSEESGFYAEEFYLDISFSAGTEVYYTLDGSEPTTHSIKYTNPILIDDASKHENVHSMRTDTSAGFRTDLIEYYKTNDGVPGYKAPDYLIDKCTIIKAVAVGAGGLKSEITTATYFVGVEPEVYDGCKIVSVLTAPENLFDEEKGIYVTGNIFEKYMEESEAVNKDWRFWRANYRQRGKDWEREATIQLFDEKGELVLTKDGGLRTRGGVSRGTLPRGMNFYCRNTYDGTTDMGLCMFDDEHIPSSVSFSSGGNQLITLFSDYMMTERTSNLNYSVLAFEPCVMFLDGEYWGFYWLTEKFDERYFEHYYGVDSSQVVMMKTDDVEVGNDKDAALYNEMHEFISTNDMSEEENYKKACGLIDIESCIDYYATMIYIARTEDWPEFNFALWRTKTVTDQEYSDGRWRWVLFDCNSTSMRDDIGLTEHNTLDEVLARDSLFASLWKNDEFRASFKERILYIADECFATEDMNQFIAEYNEKMVPILSKSWTRFYGRDNDKLEVFYSEMESYRSFFENRKPVVESWFIDWE